MDENVYHFECSFKVDCHSLLFHPWSDLANNIFFTGLFLTENQRSIHLTPEDTFSFESRKPEVERMMELKRNNKLDRRRLKSTALKNLLFDPLQKETASAETEENKATTSSTTDNKPSSRGKVEHKPGK